MFPSFDHFYSYIQKLRTKPLKNNKQGVVGKESFMSKRKLKMV